MSLFNSPKDVTVDGFFKDIVPKQFEELVKGKKFSGIAGKDFTLQYDVSGKKYCLLIKGGSNLEMVAGGVTKPILTLCLSEDDFRKVIAGQAEGVIDRFSDPFQVADLNLYNALLGTKGKLNVELDSGAMKFSMIFNGEAQPEATIKLALEDWVAMQKKETNGQNLVMAGKMGFDGDMVFLMSLNNLL
jgi:putative sterol carrier protein